MAKKIKFNLIVDGYKCRTCDELKDNFNLLEVIDYFENSKLEKWLDARGFDETLSSIEKIDKKSNIKKIAQELCTIFEIDFSSDDLDIELENYQFLKDNKDSTEKEKINKLTKQNRELEVQIASFKEEKENEQFELLFKLDIAEAKKKQHKNELMERTNQLYKIELERDKYKEEIKKLTNQLFHYQQIETESINQLQNLDNNSKSELKKLHSQLSQYKESQSELVKKLDKIETEKKQYKNAIVALKNQLFHNQQRESESIQKLKFENDKYKKEIGELNSPSNIASIFGVPIQTIKVEKQSDTIDINEALQGLSRAFK